MTENVDLRWKLLRSILSFLCAIVGLFLIFAYAKPPVRFTNGTGWQVAPNHEYVLGLGQVNPGRYKLYIITDESQQILVQDDTWSFNYVMISPDSTMIAFLRDERGSRYLEILSPDGQQLDKIDLSDDISFMTYVAWAPDSESLLVAGQLRVECEGRDRCYSVRVVRVYLDDHTVEPFIEADCATPPYDQGCLRFYNPPNSMNVGLYWRADNEAYYLLANVAGANWDWFIFPINASLSDNFAQYQLTVPGTSLPPEAFVYESNQRTNQRLPFEVNLRDRSNKTLYFEDAYVRMIAVGGVLLIIAFSLSVLWSIATLRKD